MFNLSDCTATVKFKPCTWSPDPQVFTELNIKVVHPHLGKVASLYARQIDMRRLCTDDPRCYTFHQIMDPEDQELATLARELWDKHGVVRPWLIQDEKFKGTGCWADDDLNASKRIYIFNIVVDEKVRGQGLDSVAIEHLLRSEHVGPNVIVVTWPHPPPSRDSQRTRAVFEEQMGESISFYHKHGFRRIGLTQFFGYSSKPDHLSRGIPAIDDAPYLRTRREASARADMLEHRLSGAWATMIVGWDGKAEEEVAYKADYPLHDAISRVFNEEMDIIIRDAYEADPSSIRGKDNNGFTPLHRAAEFHNARAVQTLLGLGAHSDLFLRDNADMKTPLMLCEYELRLRRELEEIRRDCWNGYYIQGLRAGAMMKRAMGLYAGTDEVYVQQYRWGCTCGKCIAGWLSPKVRQGLKDCAESLYDHGEDTCDLEFTEPRQPIRPEMIEGDLGLPYIPPQLHGSIYKTFYKGFYKVFGALAVVISDLDDKDLPTTEEMRRRVLLKLSGSEAWTHYSIEYSYFDSRSVQFYLQKGGKVEYALDCLIDQLPAQFETDWIDDQLEAKHPDRWANNPEMQEYIAKKSTLPECANDSEFQLLRDCMGLPRRMGPYYKTRPPSPPMGFGIFGAGGLFGFGGDEDEDDSDEDGSDTTVGEMETVNEDPDEDNSMDEDLDEEEDTDMIGEEDADKDEEGDE